MVVDQNFLKVRKFFISIFIFLISINVSFAENLTFKKIVNLNIKKVKIFGVGKLLKKPTDENIKCSKGVKFE